MNPLRFVARPTTAPSDAVPKVFLEAGSREVQSWAANVWSAAGVEPLFVLVPDCKASFLNNLVSSRAPVPLRYSDDDFLVYAQDMPEQDFVYHAAATRAMMHVGDPGIRP
ncbi:hypothetical protein Rhopal_001839-T1 [Rhodotorula paludigena]|uniref:Uncharacterized protein n=1 Tax=Rhodotorula paludigena TaxID=86838 RepID=A0AAV5GJK6_9BASI|nr:hypothetical protein Rhopal_001839-T1 [Rhodotorula paludigena]